MINHAGTKVAKISKEAQLRRVVMTNMLWENGAYCDGTESTVLINQLVSELPTPKVAAIAVEAKEKWKLRHVPLYICVCLAKHKKLNASLLTRVITRPDEMMEFLALYWKDGRCPIARQVRVGIREAFDKFDEYQLRKYQEKDQVITLADVIKLVHPNPKTEQRSNLFRRILEGSINTPPTWEQQLSSGKNKKEVFTSLLQEKKLGAHALLQNLRNMLESGVNNDLIVTALDEINTSKVLPYRFIVAAKHAQSLKDDLELAMFKSLDKSIKLRGKTIVMVDVSGSMGVTLAKKGKSSHLDAASSLALLLREVCDDCVIYATAGDDNTKIHNTKKIKNYRGFKVADELYDAMQTMGYGGIFLTPSTQFIKDKEKSADRFIVITDEQDTSGNIRDYDPSKASAFADRNYVINVSKEQHGVASKKWTHIDGFSEYIINYIAELESE